MGMSFALQRLFIAAVSGIHSRYRIPWGRSGFDRAYW
jgi:hypothetical protein